MRKGFCVALYCVAASQLLTACSSVNVARQQGRQDLFEVSQAPSRRGAVGRALGASPDLCQNPNAADMQALRDRYYKTLAGCSAVLADYERQAKDAKLAMTALAIVGGVAGSVVVPSLAAKAQASKSAIAGWSGLAGATNFAQHVFVNEGLAAGDAVRVREGIRGQLTAAIQSFTSPDSDYCVREDALAKMAAACINYEIFSPSQPINESPSTPAKPDPSTTTGGSGQPLAPELPASGATK